MKTLEEIRLEKIQAESAAFYSFTKEGEEGVKNEENSELNFRVLSLQEIRSARRESDVKKHTPENSSQPDSTTANPTTNELETFADICEKSSENSQSLKKPIKLRRCFKRSNEIPIDNIGNKCKRIKYTNGCEISTDVSSTINNEIVNKEDKINSVENSVLLSTVGGDCDKYQSDVESKDDSELLKDIDDLLCD